MKQLCSVALGSSLALLGLFPLAACDSGTVDNADATGGSAATIPGGNGTTAGGSAVGQAGSATGVVGTGAGGSAASTGGGASVAGTSNASNGGSGALGTGGAPAVSCSDTPPNNGDTCAHAVQYGWCTQSWLGDSCQQSCGKCSGGTPGSGGTASNGGSTGSAGAPQGGGGQPPVITGGKDGWATRYWDCCKPACGWKANVPGGTNPVASCNQADQSMGSNYDTQSACQSGSAYMCGNFGPWAVSDTLAYGFAAVNQGSDFCGRCYQLQFTGQSHNSNNDAGSQSLAGKTLIVQAINNGGVDGTQFDLLIPGGGVGDFNACSTQWGTSDLGEQYGGFFLACQKSNGYDYAKSKACAAAKCQSVFSGKADLLAGCNWFVNWFGAPDNPALKYQEVTCPAAITSLSGLHR